MTAWSYYVGPVGGIVSIPDNWCSTSYSACAATQTVIASGDYPRYAGGIGWTATMVHLPHPWNTYLVAGSHVNGNGKFEQRSFCAPAMTGPFTTIATDAVVGTTGLNFPQPMLDTLTVTGTTGTIAVISGGASSDPTNYNPFWSIYALDGGVRRPTRPGRLWNMVRSWLGSGASRPKTSVRSALP